MVLASANRLFCRIALAFLIHSSVAATLHKAFLGSLLLSCSTFLDFIYLIYRICSSVWVKTWI